MQGEFDKISGALSSLVCSMDVFRLIGIVCFALYVCQCCYIWMCSKTLFGCTFLWDFTLRHGVPCLFANCCFSNRKFLSTKLIERWYMFLKRNREGSCVSRGLGPRLSMHCDSVSVQTSLQVVTRLVHPLNTSSRDANSNLLIMCCDTFYNLTVPWYWHLQSLCEQSSAHRHFVLQVVKSISISNGSCHRQARLQQYYIFIFRLEDRLGQFNTCVGLHTYATLNPKLYIDPEAVKGCCKQLKWPECPCCHQALFITGNRMDELTAQNAAVFKIPSWRCYIPFVAYIKRELWDVDVWWTHQPLLYILASSITSGLEWTAHMTCFSQPYTRISKSLCETPWAFIVR